MIRMAVSARWREVATRPGVLATAGVFAVLFGLAVSLDYPRAARGFKGDEATYYSLTHSIARDFDFTFQRQDLVRVWEEFPGPEGIFLKRGSRIAFARTSGFPFIHMVRTEDPARYRLYYAKSYIYPLFAAPFVRVFGTNGFLVFHALLLALSFAVATRFLEALGAKTVMAASFAAVFIFASVVPIYFFWLMPEVFNFSIVFCAYFLWTYKLIAPAAESHSRLERFLRSDRSDYAAAVLLGIATFSKPTHVILIAPPLAFALLRRDYRRVLLSGACFASVVVALFAFNAAVTGDFNYQGGNRKTFYSRTGFPFANTWETFENRGQGMTTDAVPFDILLHRDTATVLLWNLWYFVAGRYSGLFAYFFPGLVAVSMFLSARRDRRLWQWLVAGALAAGAVGLICYMPYTYSGGGAAIGNRYYLGYYPLFLFLMPPLRSVRPILTALTIGALFTAKLIFNPFYTSSNPGEHAKAGPLRLLPIELTLLNDLAVSADPERSRRPLGWYATRRGVLRGRWRVSARRRQVLVAGTIASRRDTAQPDATRRQRRCRSDARARLVVRVDKRQRGQPRGSAIGLASGHGGSRAGRNTRRRAGGRRRRAVQAGAVSNQLRVFGIVGRAGGVRAVPRRHHEQR